MRERDDVKDASPPFVVQVEELQKSFGAQPAVDGLSFDVGENEFVSLVGPSGCGKSTTLRIVAGLEPSSSGTVRVRGRDVDRPIPDAAMVFQSPVLLPWRRTVANVLFPAEMRHGRISAEHRERSNELIDLAGLGGFGDRYPHELSGGMQQRVSICRALLLDPALLLMDEPFGALDILTRERMGFELERIWSATKSTVLFVTHSITEAVLLSDRILVLSRRPGRLRAVVPVALDRPRSVATMSDATFVELSATVRGLLES